MLEERLDGWGRVYSGDDGLCILVFTNEGNMGWGSTNKRCKEEIELVDTYWQHC